MEPLLKVRLVALLWDEEAEIAINVPKWGDMPEEEQDAILEELEGVIYEHLMSIVEDLELNNDPTDTHSDIADNDD